MRGVLDMNTDSVIINLVDSSRIEELLDTLELYYEDEQAVFDLTFVALCVAKAHGIEEESFHAVLEQQKPLAEKFLEGLHE